MQVTFKPKDFKTFRGVEDVLKGRFGDTTYVGTNSMCVFIEYSPKLAAMIRPYPPQETLEYEVKMLKCEDCPLERPFVAAKDENTFLCDSCLTKRKKKK